MKNTLIILLFLLTALKHTPVLSQTKPPQIKLSPTAGILFKNVKTKLSVAEINNLLSKLNLSLSADRKSFILKDDPESSYSVDALPVDLNKDGKEEIFILESSSFFGNIGSQFSLFIKDNKGIYQSVVSSLGIPMILSTSNFGYPDLLIGSPGMEQPVWRYNGSNYLFYKRIKDDGKTISTDVYELSKSYGNSIK